jgi:preprotein translocase subunit SecE
MSHDETTTKTASGELPEGDVPAPEAIEPAAGGDGDDFVPTSLGAAKYVHAAFFVVGIVVAYVSGKLLATAWNALAAWPAAVRSVPQLLLYGEDERPKFTLAVGFVLGALTLVKLIRTPGIRKWADDVAAELSKVVWPTKETVRNGTVVVVVASALATVYVGLLDRLWGFVTTLVYGA